MLIYCKDHLFDFVKQLKITPHYVWLEVNKSIFFNMDDNIRICVVYNPPDNSPYCNKDIFEDISEYLLTWTNSNSPVLIVGDLNSRTSESPDYEEGDKIDETYIIPSRGTIPIKRKNCDRKENKMGKKLLHLCKSHNLQLLNGRASGDQHGAFTFFDSEEGASAIDVSIASDYLVPLVKSFLVHRQDELSKHCKITVRLMNMKSSINTIKPKNKDYQWIPAPRQLYLERRSGRRLW